MKVVLKTVTFFPLSVHFFSSTEKTGSVASSLHFVYPFPSMELNE